MQHNLQHTQRSDPNQNQTHVQLLPELQNQHLVVAESPSGLVRFLAQLWFMQTGGRLILHVPVGLDPSASKEEADGGSKREKRAKRPAKIPAGTIVAAKVTSVHSTHIGVELDSGELHICNAAN